jgi:hypothetical protein
MSKREPSVLLDDLRTSIEKIQRYTTGLNEGSFLGGEKTTDAVVRNLEIIGEAAKQLPAEFKKTLGDSMAANRRFAQPHRVGLCGNRFETCLEHFANSDSQVGPSNHRVEIANIGGNRDFQSTRVRASSFRMVLSVPAKFVFIRVHSWLGESAAWILG